MSHKNNRTDFDALREDNSEKARLTSEQVNLNSKDNPLAERVHGRFETEQQKEQFEAQEYINDERVVELDDEDN